MGIRAWLTGRDLVEERSGPPWHPAGEWPTLDVALSNTSSLTAGGSADSLALGVPTAYRAIDITTTQLSQFPMVAHRDDEPTDYQPRVLRRPDPRGNYRTFIELTVRDMLFRGGATWRVAARDDDGRALVIHHVDSSLVTVEWNRRKNRTQAILDNDRTVYVAGQPAADMVYTPMITIPGRADGIGPIEAARSIVLGQITADELVRSNFTDGVYPSGAIETDRQLSQAAAADLRNQFEARNQGRRRPVVMSGGAKFTPFSMSLRDQQWIEARSWGATEVCRLFGVPTAMMNLPTQGGGSLQYNNAVSIRRDWAIQGLSPIASRLEVAFSEACLPTTQHAVMDMSDWLEEVAKGVTPNQPNPANATATNIEAQARLEPSQGNSEVA